MPAKNSLKHYLENSYYHIYNRGVEKRTIFLDQQDYAVFLSYLKDYLTNKNEAELKKKLADNNIPWIEKDKILKRLRMNNFFNEVVMLAYCLMPNHFHFFIKQKNAGSIDKFMNSLCTRYTMYFNKKYKRVGPLYQGVYKAVIITSEGQFLHLSRYIHKQALTLQGDALQKEQPCSYPEYVGKRKTQWIHPEEILSYFSKENPALSYRNFVTAGDDNYSLKDLTLEE